MATALDTISLRQMDNLLTCTVCKGSLKEPRSLPCFHSFCKHCLTKYVEIQCDQDQSKPSAQNSFKCPTCKTQFELRQNESVEGLPSNFFINNLLDILGIQEETQKLSCESCRAEIPAECRCTDCELYLCGNCWTAHNNWPDFRNHDVLTLKELTKPENQGKAKRKPCCQKHGHRNKPVEFFCNTCHELVCVNCALLDHPKPEHDFKPIELVADQHKEVLKTTSDILQKKYTASQDALEKIKATSQNLQTNTKKAKDGILHHEKVILEELTKKLKASTTVLLSHVDRHHNDVNHILSKQHDEMKNYVEKVNGSLDMAKNLIKKGSNEEILSFQNKIEENVKEIESECPKMMEPMHNGGIQYQGKATKCIVDHINLDDLGNVDCKPLRNTRIYFGTTSGALQSPTTITARGVGVSFSTQYLCERSKILKGDAKLAKQLAEWLKDEILGWKLRYRATDHGWKGSDFHRKCDGVGPTVTLVKCGISVFGGFTDQSWEGPIVDCHYKRSDTAFLFSLRNKDNVPPFKCPVYEHKKDKAILCFSQHGAIFGRGHDLYISCNANTNHSSYSNLGDSYKPPPGHKPSSAQAKALLAGSENFSPTEIEVFSN